MSDKVYANSEKGVDLEVSLEESLFSALLFKVLVCGIKNVDFLPYGAEKSFLHLRSETF